MTTNIPKKGVAIILFASLWIIASIVLVTGTPVGPQVSIGANSTISSTPYELNNSGGYIYYSDITATQQNYGWKAYVGNVSGSYTLDDSRGATIFDWNINSTTITGEVYATRHNDIDWTFVNCSNWSALENETTFFGMPETAEDNINNTFNYTTHKFMQVGVSTVDASSCRSNYLYVNDSAQEASESAYFQELVLMDRDWHVIFATFIEQDAYNYQAAGDTNTTADFQIILPENKTKAEFTAYYFYVEIG